MLQRDNFNFLVTGLIDASHYICHARYVRGAIRNNQHIRARVGYEVTVLRHQGTQDRDELRGPDILYLNDLGNDVVRACRSGGAYRTGVLTSCCVGNDLGDIAGRDRCQLVHVEN